MKLRVLDLFSGIGGFSLGLERTGGFETVAFCEIEDYPRRVLKRHWPKIPIYRDVRELSAETLSRDGVAVDVICGGFPCQDVSVAGKRAGLEGERSGLWSEFRRLIGDIRPQFVIVENVTGLLSSGMETVLGDLAALGFDAEWNCISASATGAKHKRDRVWIVSYSNKKRCPNITKRHSKVRQLKRFPTFEVWLSKRPESPILGVVNGVSDRVERNGACGNAVVPQIPELIGDAILESIETNELAKVKT